MTPIAPIHEMPTLAARLGEARVCQIAYSMVPERPEPLRNYTINEYRHLFQGYQYETLPGDLADVLYGAAVTASNGSRNPLKLSSLLAILQSIKYLSAREIAFFLNCSDRQARKYYAATRVVLVGLKRIHKPS